MKPPKSPVHHESPAHESGLARRVRKLGEFLSCPDKSQRGQTGSVQYKLDTPGGRSVSYQIKPSILDQSWKRYLKAKGSDQENLSEYLGALIARAVHPDPTLIPEVIFITDKTRQRFQVGSRYLTNARGTLDEYLTQSSGRELTARQHISVTRATSGVLETNQIALTDPILQPLTKSLAEALAVSMLVGDHDVNPSNMMVVDQKENGLQIGRIDFGHALNDLLHAPRIFGGGVRYKANRCIDFLNREQIAGFALGGDPSKLWRDYPGLIPSMVLVEAMRTVARNAERIPDALDEAETGLMQLYVGDDETQAVLSTENPLAPSKHEEVWLTSQHLAESLRMVHRHVRPNKAVARLEPIEAITGTCEAVTDFCTENARMMLEAADLMALQLEIETLCVQGAVAADAFPRTAIRDKVLSGEAIQWIKMDAAHPAFYGTLDQYVAQRTQQLREHPEQAAVSREVSPYRDIGEDLLVERFSDLLAELQAYAQSSKHVAYRVALMTLNQSFTETLALYRSERLTRTEWVNECLRALTPARHQLFSQHRDGNCVWRALVDLFDRFLQCFGCTALQTETARRVQHLKTTLTQMKPESDRDNSHPGLSLPSHR